MSERNIKIEFAAQYARDFAYPPQGQEEGDTQFHERIVGQLRAEGHVIEAQEVNAGHRFDDPSGSVVTGGITGHIALALQEKEYSKDPFRKVGDEIAAGSIARHG